MSNVNGSLDQNACILLSAMLNIAIITRVACSSQEQYTDVYRDEKCSLNFTKTDLSILIEVVHSDGYIYRAIIKRVNEYYDRLFFNDNFKHIVNEYAHFIASTIVSLYYMQVLYDDIEFNSIISRLSELLIVIEIAAEGRGFMVRCGLVFQDYVNILRSLSAKRLTEQEIRQEIGKNIQRELEDYIVSTRDIFCIIIFNFLRYVNVLFQKMKHIFHKMRHG
ncbi:MAG: hypothetical protein QXH07_07030 [Thermoplasmata archaeon]